MTRMGTITQDEADDIFYGEHVAQQFVSEHRWYNRLLIVFQSEDGSLRGFYYMQPATEMQEDQDRYESDPVKTFPVEAREITTTVYDALPEASSVQPQ